MQLFSTKRSHFGLLLGLCACGSAFALHGLGGFRAVENYFSDSLQTWSSAYSQKSNVLIVYSQPNAVRNVDDKLIALLNEINLHQPKQIVLISHAKIDNAANLSLLPFADKITIGCLAKDWQPQLRDIGIAQGIVDFDLDGQPVYRTHWAAKQFAGNVFPAVESVIAKRVLPANATTPDHSFGIRYRGGINSLPNVRADQLRDGSVVPQMINNKIVLVGEYAEAFGYATPMTGGSERMQGMELHGHILESLLEQDVLWDCPWLVALVLLSLAAVLFFVTVCQLSIRSVPLAVAGAVIVSLAVCFVSQMYWGLRLPIGGLLFCIFATTTVAVFFRFCAMEDAVKRIKMSLRENTSHLDEDPWDSVKQSAMQLFSPQRMVFLELPKGKSHLEIVKTINCVEDQIEERRRDIRREPFATAIETEQLRELDGREFLRSRSEGSTQFVVPLIHDSVVQGVIVFDFAAANKLDEQDWRDSVDAFAAEMAAFLAVQSQQQRTLESSGTLAVRMSTLPEDHSLQTILQQEFQTTEYVQRLQDLLESSSRSLAVCDPFGRVKFANESMVELLDDRQVLASESCALELMIAISRKTSAECRDILRDVINNRNVAQLLVIPQQENDSPLVLNIRPLGVETVGGSVNYPHIAFEVIDGRQFQLFHGWQSGVTSLVCESAKMPLDKLAEEIATASQPDQSSDSLASVFGSISDAISRLQKVVGQCGELADYRISESPSDCLPVETTTVFDSADRMYRPRFKDRDVQVRVRDCDEKIVGIANPILLERIFGAIFEILLENSVVGSEVTVSAINAEQQVCYRFECNGKVSEGSTLSGTGPTADGRLSGVLANEKHTRLDQVKEWLTEWNGFLTLSSDPDQHTGVIELVLAGAPFASDATTEGRDSKSADQSGRCRGL